VNEFTVLNSLQVALNPDPDETKPTEVSRDATIPLKNGIQKDS
jgi:hypothetical protein